MVREINTNENKLILYDSTFNDAISFKLRKIRIVRVKNINREQLRTKLRNTLIGLHLPLPPTSIAPIIEEPISPEPITRIRSASYEYVPDTINPTVIDGFNVDTFYNNVQYFNFGRFNVESSSPKIMLIDSASHLYSFLAEFVDYCTSDTHVGAIFANPPNVSYYENYCDTHSILRDHIIFNQVTNGILQSQRYQGEIGNGNREFVIIDSPSTEVTNSNEYRDLCFNGRHFRTGHMIRTNYNVMLPPNLRTSYDVIILNPMELNLYDSSVSNIWSSYFGIFPSLTFFKSLLMKMRQNHQYLVLDRRAIGNSIYSKIGKIDISSI